MSLRQHGLQVFAVGDRITPLEGWSGGIAYTQENDMSGVSNVAGWRHLT